MVSIELLSAFFGLRWRLGDIKRKVQDEGYLAGAEDTDCSSDDGLGRDDLLVLDLRKRGVLPEAGAGTSQAYAVIQKALFEGEQPLPPHGDVPAAEDRYLRPYLLRMEALLRRAEIADAVYKDPKPPFFA